MKVTKNIWLWLIFILLALVCAYACIKPDFKETVKYYILLAANISDTTFIQDVLRGGLLNV